MSKGVTAVKDLSVAKELIREAIDPAILLEYYGMDISDSNYRYNKVRCACPLHGGDNPTAFSFDLNTKMFTCFTSHCGEDSDDWWFIPKDGGAVPRDMFLFIKLMEEKKAYENGAKNFRCSFTQALKVASELSGVPIDGVSSVYNKDLVDKLDNQKFARHMAKIGNNIELEIFNQDEVDMFKAQLPMCCYIDTRGYDENILDFFEIGYSPDGIDEPWNMRNKEFTGRVIFPIRDSDGNLVGWSGRLATDDKILIKKFNKWMHKLDFEKGFVLYNFNNAREFVRKSKELILVEGPFDVLRMWSCGIYNAVAVMGSSLTPEQLSLTITHSIKVKVFLDGDGAGQTGSRRICEQLSRYVDTYIATPSDDKDPDELSNKELHMCLSNAKKYVSERRVAR